jgi:hypothetical protein
MVFTQRPSAHLLSLATTHSIGTILDGSKSLASFTAVTKKLPVVRSCLMNGELQFFMSPGDETEFVEFARDLADSLDKESEILRHARSRYDYARLR